MLDPEKEFVSHLVNIDSLKTIIRENLPEELLSSSQKKQVYLFAKQYFKDSGTSPSKEVLESEFEIAIDEPLSTVEWTIEKLRLRYMGNQVWEIATAIADQQKDPVRAFEILRERTVEAERNIVSNKYSFSLQDYPTFLSELQDDIASKGMYRDYSIGFKSIDNFTGGYHPGQLGFIAARPKRCKSWMMLMAFLEQIRAGQNPVLFTLELTHKEIMNRLQCLITGYSWDKAQRGDISSTKEWELLERGWKKFTETHSGGFIVQPLPDERTVSQLMIQADNLGADSILISQLKQIKPTKFYRTTYEGYNEIVLDLKQACLRPNKEMPILVEAQFNREAQNIKELQEMDLAQLGLTDAIGQTADVVYGIIQTPEQRQMDMIEFGVIEARNHNKGSWMIETKFKDSTTVILRGSRS